MTAAQGSVLSARRPFPGLRPFGADDRDFFFGRDAQIYALYSLLDLSRFVAVVGSSGSGKSSLVRAGLLPVLDDEAAEDGGRGWSWAEMRPGDAPLAELTRALVGLAGKVAPQDNEALAATRAERIAYHLSNSSRGIAGAIGEIGGIKDRSIILLVDQFEELFRFSASATDGGRSAHAVAHAREEAAHFMQLLLEASRSPLADLRIVLTMRSDFIGDCSRFQGLPEAVSGTQFLVPSLTRDQRKTVIADPIKTAGGTIDPQLIERLLNDSGEEFDQLPVLQHCLLRLWERAESDATGARHISLPEYVDIGGMAGALSQHADEILKNDLPGREAIVESVFRALSDIDREGRATRRAVPFAQLLAETAVPATELAAVLDRFRADDCSFLTPSLTTAPTLPETTLIDVGHEALLRRWEKVSRATREKGDPRSVGWLQEEREDGRRYQALLAITESDDDGPVLLPFDQVERRWKWWTERPHTEAWALRYGGGHERVERLLRDSRAAFEADVHRREEEGRDRRRARATRIALGLVALLLVGAIGVGGLFYQQRQNAVQERERAIATLTDALTFLKMFSGTILTGLNAGTVTSSGARDLIASVERMIDGITAPTTQTEEIAANTLLVMSDVMAVLGNTAEALARAREADELAQRLVKTDPDNSVWQLMVFRSAFRIGDAMIPAGDLKAVLAQYRDAEAIAEALVNKEPENGAFLYDLAFIENKVGEILALHKDFAAAFAKYDAALAIARKIAAMTPPTVSWQIYVSATLIKMAKALAEQPEPDFESALDKCGEAVRLAEEVHSSAPNNEVVISNRARAHGRRGNILVQRWADGDFAIAVLDYTQAINLQRSLIARDPANASLLASLAPYHAGLGAAFERNSDLSEALAQYEAELEIRQRLADKDPSNGTWQRGLQAAKGRIERLKGKMEPPTGGPDQKP